MGECYPEAICGDCPMCAPWVAIGAPPGAQALGTNRKPRFAVEVED